MSQINTTPEQLAKKMAHFRRVIRYRSYFGWIFAVVGAILFFVGLENNQMPLIMINGALFFWIWFFYGMADKKSTRATRSRPTIKILSSMPNARA